MKKDQYYIQRIEDYFDSLKISAVAKFKAGRKEHNDDLMKLDVDKEIDAELIDILIYRIIQREQKI